MKRRTQEKGELDWAAEDLIELQSQPFEMIDAVFKQFENVVISGCEVFEDSINNGVVMIDGMVMPFSTTSVVSYPCYLIASKNAVNQRYVDGLEKPVAYDYKAVITAVLPQEGGFITVNNTGVERLLRKASDATDSDSSDTFATSKAVSEVNRKVDDLANAEIPKSDRIDLDDSDTFASSKAVHDVNAKIKPLALANSTDIGGIKAKDKTTETAEVAIDPESGKLFAPTISGETGADGSVWFTGTDVSGTSTSSVTIANSKIGDFYINSSTGYYYEKTSNTVWTYRGSLRGVAGVDGRNGTNGTNGYNGSDGQGFTDMGAWNSSAYYYQYYCVHYDGCYWCAKSYGSGNTPFEGSSYWTLVAKKGDKGETGVFDPSTILSSLTTSDKTVPGAINELNSGKANTSLSNVSLTKSLSSDGYYKAPDGFLIQWGRGVGSGYTTIYYPTSFSSAYSVVCVPITTPNEGAVVSACTLNIGTSSFTERSRWTHNGSMGDNASTFCWIATGRWY